MASFLTKLSESELRNKMAEVAREWRKSKYVPVNIKVAKTAKERRFIYRYLWFKEACMRLGWL